MREHNLLYESNITQSNPNRFLGETCGDVKTYRKIN